MLADDNVFPKIIGAEQGSDPAAAAAGQRKLYAKSDGWYEIDDAGAVTGPFGAGGGGGGGTTKLPLEPSAPTDGFPGTSLDAAWNLAGSYVAGDFTVADSWLACPVARAAGSYVYRTPPGSWSTITAKFACLVPTAAWCGLLAVDNSGAGVGWGAAWHGTPDVGVIGPLAAGAYTGSDGLVNNNIVGSLASQGLPYFLRLRKSGTSWFGSASLNGANWTPETAALTNATAITRIGFGSLLGTAASFAVDWFNVA